MEARVRVQSDGRVLRARLSMGLVALLPADRAPKALLVAL
jgi:hypothetical protein